mmetsp:Transcript_59017/g.97003  ORF Transcript_59017/g.97003 Transcript_59017/m.97003 type:complete len:224 (+) Transcript_59017:382-1053(+)
MDDHVQSHQFVKAWVIVPEHAAEVAGEIRAPVLHNLAIMVSATVHKRRDLGQLGDHADDVVIHGVPVLGLTGSLLIGPGELALRLAGQQPNLELGHGVHGLVGQPADDSLRFRRDITVFVQLGRQGCLLLFGGNVTSQQQPDQPLRGWFTCTGWASEGGQCFLQIWDGVAAEADALIGVQQRGLPEHALDAARAPDALINRHLPKNNIPILLLQGLDVVTLGR